MADVPGFDVNEFIGDELEDKYGGTAGELKALAAGAARGATFGLSDVALTATGAVKPETLKGLQETNPIASGVGEFGSMLIPGGAIGAVAKGAMGVAKAANVGSRVAEKAIQYGTEGAIYGLGQSISESALGDHDLISEQTLANVGISSLLSGAIGGAVGKLTKGKADDVVNSLDNSTPEEIFAAEKLKAETPPGSLQSIVANSDLPPAERTFLVEKALAEKPDAKRLRKDFAEAGLPEVPGQLAEHEVAQKTASMMSQLPFSNGGEQIREAVKTGYQRIDDIVKQAFGAEHLDAETNGLKLAETIKNKVKSLTKPIDDAYAQRSAVGEKIKIADEEALAAYKKLVDLSYTDDVFKTETNKGREIVRAEAENFLREVSSNNPIYKLDEYSKIMSQRARESFGKSREEYDAWKAIQSFVDDFRNTHLDKWGQKADIENYEILKKDVAQQKRLFSAIFGTRIGKKATTDFRINEALDQIPAEQLVNKFFDPKNAKRLRLIKESMPEVYDALVQAKKSEFYLKESAKKNFSSYSLIKSMDNPQVISNSTKKIMFGPEIDKQMKIVTEWVENLPVKVGPSGTPEGMAYLDMLQNPRSGIINMITSNLTGKAGMAYLNSIGKAEGSHTLSTLVALNKAAVKTQKAVVQGTNHFFDHYAKPLTLKSISKTTPEWDNEEYDKVKDEINESANNPIYFEDKMQKATEGLYAGAPNITSSMQVNMVKGVQFLASKLPKDEPNDFLAPKSIASKSQMAKFKRYYDVVNDPTIAMKQLNAGMVPPETIETLTQVFPRLYLDMKQALTDKMTSTKDVKDMPYSKKMVISQFLGQPMVKSLNPNFIQSTQGLFAQSMQENNANNNPQGTKFKSGGMKDMTLASRMTVNQRNDDV